MLNRETWLENLIEELKPLFKESGYDLPSVKISIGFPSVKGTSNKLRRIGECWPRNRSKDNLNQIFLNPTQSDSVEIMGTVIHELVHAIDDCKNGHKAAFKRIATTVGLEGKMTATTINDSLRERLNVILNNIGKIPHAALDAIKGNKKKQGTRMIKIECPECGYTLRTTQKWIDTGIPTCCCGSDMESV